MKPPNSEFDSDLAEYQEEWLSAYLDDELTEEQRRIVETRLANDPAAQATLHDLQNIRGLVQQLPGWGGREVKLSAEALTITDEHASETVYDQQESEDEYRVDGGEAAVQPASSEDRFLERVGPSDLNILWHEARRKRSSGWRWLRPLAIAASMLLMLAIGYVLWSGSERGGELARSNSEANSEVQNSAPQELFRNSRAKEEGEPPSESNDRQRGDEWSMRPLLEANEPPADGVTAVEPMVEDAGAEPVRSMDSGTTADEQLGVDATASKSSSAGRSGRAKLGESLSESQSLVQPQGGAAELKSSGAGPAEQLNFGSSVEDSVAAAPPAPATDAAPAPAPPAARAERLEEFSPLAEIPVPEASLPEVAATAPEAGNRSEKDFESPAVEPEKRPILVARSELWDDARIELELTNNPALSHLRRGPQAASLYSYFGPSSSETLEQEPYSGFPAPLVVARLRSDQDARQLFERLMDEQGLTASVGARSGSGGREPDAAAPAPSIMLFLNRSQAEQVLQQLAAEEATAKKTRHMWITPTAASEGTARAAAADERVVLLLNPTRP